MDKQKGTSVGFQLVKVTTKQFAVIDDAYSSSSSEEIKMSINLDFGTDEKNKFVASTVNVKFIQNEKTFLTLEVEAQFAIEEEAWIKMTNNNNQIVFPRWFATHLTTITIGTLRGVLHAKTDGTEFNKFMLPTINIMELIEKDIVVETSK